jgi:hypothetical protein
MTREDRNYPEAMIETQYLGGGKGPSRRMFLITEEALDTLLYQWAETRENQFQEMGMSPDEVAQDAFDFIAERCEDFDVDPGPDNPPVKWSLK